MGDDDKPCLSWCVLETECEEGRGRVGVGRGVCGRDEVREEWREKKELEKKELVMCRPRRQARISRAAAHPQSQRKRVQDAQEGGSEHFLLGLGWGPREEGM